MPKDVFTDRLDFQSTIMFGLQAMFKEAAADGFDKEFEDIVDLLCFQISFLIKRAGKWDEWVDLDKIGADTPIADTVGQLKHKRTRIRKKMILAVEVLDKYKLLLKKVDSFKWDFNPMDLEDGSTGGQ